MDNVTNIEPADNEERLLKGILEGDTETNIEPAGNKERLLKGILEKLGGGGGGGGATSVTLVASGDNLSGDISLADLKTALSNGVVLLSFPTDGNADERVVAEYTDDSTNGLRIGVFSEDEYIVYSVVDDGNDGVTLTVVSESDLGTSTIDLTSSELNEVNSVVMAAAMAAGTDMGVTHVKYSDADFTTVLDKISSIPFNQKVLVNMPLEQGAETLVPVTNMGRVSNTVNIFSIAGSFIRQQTWLHLIVTFTPTRVYVSAVTNVN